MAVVKPQRRRTTPLFNPTGIGQDDGGGDEGGSVQGEQDQHSNDTPETVTTSTDEPQVRQDAGPSDLQRSAPLGLARSDAKTESDTEQPSLMMEQHRKRGRRRRSSERPVSGEQVYHNGVDSQDTLSAQRTASSSTSSPATKLWWQRGEPAGDRPPRSREDSLAMSMTSEGSSSARTPARQPELKIDASVALQRERQESYESTSQSSNIKSPAAAFLSSMNERLASPSSHMSSDSTGISNRGYSMSPQRVGTAATMISSPQASMIRNRLASNSDMQPSSSSFGMAGAAAQSSDAMPSRPASIRVDEEGARFGPHGRYRLGKAIGFGGFSVIREAWDTIGGTADPEHDLFSDSLQPHWHRVAVKVIRGAHPSAGRSNEQNDDTGAEDELQVWEDLPAHSNLLPLLYHEKIDAEDGSFTLLVMPFCEGNLMSFVRSGGTLGEPLALPLLSRAGSISGALGNGDTDLSASIHSAYDGPVANMAQAKLSRHPPRTGSGYVPHPRREASAGDRLVSIPLSNVLARSLSISGSVPRSVGSNGEGTHMRRASIRSRPIQGQQSKGVPIDAARDIMRQMTEALLCLHHRALILHGDIKLENVLGQQWLTQAQSGTLQSDEANDEGMTPQSDGEGQHATAQASAEDVKLDDESPISASICWRLADFGLAKRVIQDQGNVMREDDHAVAKMEYVVQQARLAHGHEPARSESMARNRSASSQGVTQSRLGGGSLAYKAPEAFYDLDEVSEASLASPFAADMWALGCIMYALFSGRLPFSDSFEPRLQMKIAQGQWEMPDRLKVRRDRKARDRTDTQKATEPKHANSFGAHSATGSRPMSLQMSADVHSALPIDMSASLPQLPRNDKNDNESQMAIAPSMQSIVQHDEQGCDEKEEDDDEDSDGEDRHDASVDGTSRERAAIRAVLRGLLQPDPSKRWTVEKLATAAWIQQDIATSQIVPAPMAAGSAALQVPMAPDDLPRSLQDIIEAQAAPANGFEDDHGDVARPLPNDSMLNYDTEDSQQTRRGRSSRRPEDVGTYSAKPITIDRSKSRSRSRGGSEREPAPPTWGFDVPAPSAAFHNRREASDSAGSRREHDVRGRHKQSRSTSADPHRENATVPTHRRSSRGSDQARPTSSRKSSRSVSRTRRMDIEHIMPQLSLRRSASGDLPAHEPTIDEAAASTHMASRSSLWKSPLRARDRLMHMMGGGSGNASSSNSSLASRKPQEDEQH